MPVGQHGEDAIVGSLLRRFSAKAAGVRLGIGDDAAVLRTKGASEDLVITTDMLLEDVDFRRSWISPDQLGHKALAANLSDLAAMGASPRWHLVGLALPDDVGDGWIRSFYSGMKGLGDHWGTALVGGDLSRSPSGVQITVVALGETRGRRPVLRRGGKPGDRVFVTGTPGRSAAGLHLLERGIVRGRTKGEREALRAHRTPTPRCDVGSWLADRGLASCMMDLSDGISADLPRLCSASKTGVVVDTHSLPLFAPAARWGCDPIEFALHGGEDFELLFSVPALRVDDLHRLYPARFPPATLIGVLTRDRNVMQIPRPGSPPQPIPRLAFDHFGRRG